MLSLSDNSLTIPISVVQSSVRSLSFKSSFLTNKEATPQTIFSRISKSFKVFYPHVAARILRSATKDLNGSPCFCVLASHLNLCLSITTGTFRSDYEYEYEYEFFNVYPVRVRDCVRLSRQLVLSSKSRRRLDTNYEIFNKSRPPTTSSLQVQSRVKRLVFKHADTL